MPTSITSDQDTVVAQIESAAHARVFHALTEKYVGRKLLSVAFDFSF